jgi:hypothetical protein
MKLKEWTYRTSVYADGFWLLKDEVLNIHSTRHQGYLSALGPSGFQSAALTFS